MTGGLPQEAHLWNEAGRAQMWGANRAAISGQPHDIWEAQPDVVVDHPMYPGEAGITQAPIPPNRLRLLTEERTANLTPEEWHSVDDTWEQMPLKALLPDRACYETSADLARKHGWPQESGYYRGTGHYWNRKPDGTIVDASHDQFDENEPVRVVEPDDPAQAEYKRDERMSKVGVVRDMAERHKVYRVVDAEETPEIQRTGEFPIHHGFGNGVYHFKTLAQAEDYRQMMQGTWGTQVPHHIWEAEMPSDPDYTENDPDWGGGKVGWGVKPTRLLSEGTTAGWHESAMDAGDQVEHWISQYGRTMPYAQLPSAAQKSIHNYMNDPEAEPWEAGPNDYFGYAEIPAAEMHAAKDHKYPDSDMIAGGFEGRGVPPGSSEVWPVTLDRDYGDLLQDGWHRLHQYRQQGIDPIPAVYFPDASEGTTARTANLKFAAGDWPEIKPGVYPVDYWDEQREDHGPDRITGNYFPQHDVLAVGAPGMGHADTMFGFLHQYGHNRPIGDEGRYEFNPAFDTPEFADVAKTPGEGWHMWSEHMKRPYTPQMMQRLREADSLPEVPYQPMAGKEDGPGWEDEGTTAKVSMAERSGDPQLDAFIAQYMPDAMTGLGQFGDLRIPENASGACGWIAHDFAVMAQRAGLQTEEAGDTPDQFGYADRTKPGFDEHHWVIVTTPSGRYGVDFTASQYGYSEFPMVQKLNEGGGWQRDFSTTAKVSAEGFYNWTGKWHQHPSEVTDMDAHVLNHHDDQGNVVGSLLYYPDEEDPKTMVAESVYVHPDHRRQGIASNLIRQGQQELGANNIIGMAQTPEGESLMRHFGTTAKVAGLKTAPWYVNTEGNAVVGDFGQLHGAIGAEKGFQHKGDVDPEGNVTVYDLWSNANDEEPTPQDQDAVFNHVAPFIQGHLDVEPKLLRREDWGMTGGGAVLPGEPGYAPIDWKPGPAPKLAKETPNQLQRRAEELYRSYPDTSEVVHTFPSGHTVRKLNTYGDVYRTGTIMRNCWQPPPWSPMKPPFKPQEPLFENDIGRNMHYTLNDPNGIPHTAFYYSEPQDYDSVRPMVDAGHHYIHSAFGARNRHLQPEHVQMLEDWANSLGGPIQWRNIKTAPYPGETPDADEAIPVTLGEGVPAGGQTITSAEYPLTGTPGWSSVPNHTMDWLNTNKPDEAFGQESDCINPKCEHNWTDEEQLDLAKYGDTICPDCGMMQNRNGTAGPIEDAENDSMTRGKPTNKLPGGGFARSGLPIIQMGNIGEKLVARAQTLPCGQVTHHFGGAGVYNNPVDFTTVDQHGNPWGVEVKTIDARSGPRFKLGGAGEVKKKVAYCQEHGLRQGLIGVRLNFYTDEADLFWRPQFTDPYLGDKTMTHVGTLNFADLNPFRDPATGDHHVPEQPQDIPF